MDGNRAHHVKPMVVRMSSAESIVETSRRREFEIINALADLIPVPVCYWEDELMEVFPYPVLIFGFAEGVAKPSSDNSQQVTGLGINYAGALRARVTDEFMSGHGTFHTADIARLNLDYFEEPTVGRNAGILKQVNMWRRIWDEDRGEGEALIHLAATRGTSAERDVAATIIKAEEIGILPSRAWGMGFEPDPTQVPPLTKLLSTE